MREVKKENNLGLQIASMAQTALAIPIPHIDATEINQARLAALGLSMHMSAGPADIVKAWRECLEVAIREIWNAKVAIQTDDITVDSFPKRVSIDKEGISPMSILMLTRNLANLASQALNAHMTAAFGQLPQERIMNSLMLVVHQEGWLQPATASKLKLLKIPTINFCSPLYPIQDADFAKTVAKMGVHAYSDAGELSGEGRDSRISAQELHVAGGLLLNCLGRAIRESIEFAETRNLVKQRIIIHSDLTYLEPEDGSTLSDYLSRSSGWRRRAVLNNFFYECFPRDETIFHVLKYNSQSDRERGFCGARAVFGKVELDFDFV